MTTNNKDASNPGSKYVRMFYSLVLNHDAQGTSFSNKKPDTDLERMKWEIEIFDSLGLESEVFLGSNRFQFAFDEKTGIRQQATSYLVPVLVSAIHEFKPEVLVKMPGSANFSVKTEIFISVQETLLKEIRQLLPAHLSVHELQFSMATSRVFLFDIYYEGYLTLKREFSDQEIKDNGGVNNVLSDFFDDIQSAIEPFDLQITGYPSNHRRNRDDEYTFQVYYASRTGFGENEVYGDGCFAIRGNATSDDLNHYCVDFDDVKLEETKDHLNFLLELNLPAEANLMSFKIFYVDDSEEVLDIDDDLLPIDHIEATPMLKDFMQKRSESELKFVKSRNPLPTVEVDVNDIPDKLHGYTDLVANSIKIFAAENPDKRATFYVYQGNSVNFHQHTWSAFIGVAGDEDLLDLMLDDFKAAGITNARFSDYIDLSTASREFHIQDGNVWRPLENGIWYSDDQEEENLIEEEEYLLDEQEDDDGVLAPESNETDGKNSRISTPIRYRAARADAKIGSIRRTIEKKFGLPEGSVALCGPNKKALRADATIATLRKRWES